MDSGQPSRPQSVDSVHLGSTYSGYFPSLHHQQQYQQQHQYHGIQHTQFQHSPAQSYQQQPQSYANYYYAQQPVGVVGNGGSSGPASLPAVLHSSPLSQHVNSNIPGRVDTYQSTPYQPTPSVQNYPQAPIYGQPQLQPTQQPYNIPADLTANPERTIAHMAQLAAQSAISAYQQPNQQNSDPAQRQYQYNLFLQYYLNFYQNLRRTPKQLAIQKQNVPLKYLGSKHTPVVFSMYDSQLAVVESNHRVALYRLQELFTERCYPHLCLKSTNLIDRLSTSPKVKADLAALLTSGSTSDLSSLPKPCLLFSDNLKAEEWIRIKLLHDSSMKFELRQCFKVINKLLVKEGSISGRDLSELLLDIVADGPFTTGAANNMFLNEPADSQADILSQAGSDQQQSSSLHSVVVSQPQVQQTKEQLLTQLRRLLMGGHSLSWVIDVAQKNGLFDHALALVYLTSFQANADSVEQNLNPVIDNGFMINTIHKFINTTLAVNDPLYVFYSHLLHSATTVVNSMQKSTATPVPNLVNAKIDSIESFIILVANNINFDKVEIVNNSYRNLIDLMIALLKNECDYVLPDELFQDRFDSLVANECLEYARFRGNHLNPRLLLRKLEFAFELFDFNFSHMALNYCEAILYTLKQLSFEQIRRIQTESDVALKQSRFANFLLPFSNLPPESNESPEEYIFQLWSYQVMKVVSRFDHSFASYESPLIQVIDDKTDEGEDDGGTNSDDDVENEVQETEDGDEEEEEEEVVVVVKKKKKGNEKSKQQTLVEKSSPRSTFNQSKTVNDKNKTEQVIENKKTLKSVSKVELKKHSTMHIQTKDKEIEQVKEKEIVPVKDNEEQVDVQENANTEQENEEEVVQNKTQQHLNHLISDNLSLNASPMITSTGSQHENLHSTMLSNVYGSTSANDSSNNFDVLDRSSVNDLNSSTGFAQPPSSFQSPTYGSPASLPQSPSMFDYFSQQQQQHQQSNNFQMTALQNSLLVDSGSLNNNDSKNSNKVNNLVSSGPDSMSYFLPPPPTVDDSSAPVFDFMSPGQVTNIPSFDPSLKDDNSTGNQPNHDDHPQSNYKQDASSASKDEQQKDCDPSKDSPSKNSGLFSSLFGKFRPKNQAILPDDKDPPLVYDPVQKRWVDKTAGDSASDTGVLPPPPRIPFGGVPASGEMQSELNSTLTSSITQSPSLPSFASGSSGPSSLPQQSSSAANPAVVGVSHSNGGFSNGAIPSSTSYGNLAMNVPTSGGNQYRGSIRKNRYIDVFNAPATKK